MNTPFRSLYEDDPSSKQPLIYSKSRNLSQTPREQCGLRGLVSEGLERPGAGQVGSSDIHHAVCYSAVVNGGRSMLWEASLLCTDSIHVWLVSCGQMRLLATCLLLWDQVPAQLCTAQCVRGFCMPV